MSKACKCISDFAYIAKQPCARPDANIGRANKACVAGDNSSRLNDNPLKGWLKS